MFFKISLNNKLIPPHVKRTKEIKEIIDKQEVIGENEKSDECNIGDNSNEEYTNDRKSNNVNLSKKSDCVYRPRTNKLKREEKARKS